MVHQIRIMQNGSGWYWEVVTQGREVVGRGIADTQAQARAEAENVSRREMLICELEFSDGGCAMNQAAAGGRYIRMVEARNLRRTSQSVD